jgi:hypothetical protein
VSPVPIRRTLEEVERKPWWPVANLLMLAGENVVVQDPLAIVTCEYWDDDPLHGVVQVVRRVVPGWVVSVYEPVTELDDEPSGTPDITEESEQGPPPGPA